ncbi:MAG TPA: hypothetical protein DCX32_01825 [Candidatus Moranbacteria bacterium]|nr:MAG: hypothetical protein UW87_C0009G0028 [Candidatus Moranbacteria bacterium GW2011_GWC2_45_10]KKT95108.1 MAG: hypothetical protein UW95_C0004G0026 [Parcubacteria group bacterium GW2011_GWC1_45_14]HAV11261.1 hypothetical protein [Candidatus Moranbacteria bacterium]
MSLFSISDISIFFLSFDWLSIAVGGYLLIAVVAVLDKYLLHSRISKPAVYAFYVSVFSLFALAFIPFGFSFPGTRIVAYAIFSGIFFIYGLLALYRAVQENEISRVAPLVGTIIPLVSVVYAFLFLDERLGVMGVVAVLILASGGFLISFDLPIHNMKLFKGFRYSVISGVSQAVSLGLLKEVFNGTGFINGFVWNRIGFFLAGMSLLLFPVFRKQIMKSFDQSGSSRGRVASTGALFTANKIMAGTGSFLIVLAISRGSVSAVNAVGSIQFVFVLVLVSMLSVWHHHIYREKLKFSDWMQKFLAIVFIGVGLWMLSVNSPGFFYLTS